MDEVYFQKIALANEKNILVDYVFDYEIIDNQDETYTAMLYDSVDDPYRLGSDYSSYEEAYDAVKAFRGKLEDLLDRSEEILELLEGISYWR